MNKSIKENLYFDNNTWNYVSKEVNLNTCQIQYVTKSGFGCYEEAYAAYEKDRYNFEQSMIKMKKAVGMQFTFSSYLNYWYRNILQTYAFGSYQAGCAWVIYDIILPAVDKDVLLSMVTAPYLNHILKKCSEVCRTSGYEARRIINLAIKDAIADGYLKTNPMGGVDHYLCKTPNVVIYSKDEIKKLLAAAYRYHSIYLEVLLALFCGLRQGEVLGLKYSDFDFNNRTVEIRRQITRDYEVEISEENSVTYRGSSQCVKPPKSFSSYRTLRVPDVILDEVKKRKAENMETKERARYYDNEWEDYLCLGKNGKIKSCSTLLSALKKICRQYALPPTGMHGLRHVYASILIEQNVPLEKISKLMGHKSVTTTFEIYCGIIQGKEHIRNYIDGNLNPQIAAIKMMVDGGE